MQYSIAAHMAQIQYLQGVRRSERDSPRHGGHYGLFTATYKKVGISLRRPRPPVVFQNLFCNVLQAISSHYKACTTVKLRPPPDATV